jgi:hypothetical protein
MTEDPHMRISRPRQVYTGATERPFVPIDERTETATKEPEKLTAV